jgi:hypothetical protein
MAGEEKKDVEISRTEKRTFAYVGESEVNFNFEIDVSTPDVAVTEIADFIALLDKAKSDMVLLQGEFAKKLEGEKPAPVAADEKKDGDNKK